MDRKATSMNNSVRIKGERVKTSPTPASTAAKTPAPTTVEMKRGTLVSYLEESTGGASVVIGGPGEYARCAESPRGEYAACAESWGAAPEPDLGGPVGEIPRASPRQDSGSSGLLAAASALPGILGSATALPALAQIPRAKAAVTDPDLDPLEPNTKRQRVSASPALGDAIPAGHAADPVPELVPGADGLRGQREDEWPDDAPADKQRRTTENEIIDEESGET